MGIWVLESMEGKSIQKILDVLKKQKLGTTQRELSRKTGLSRPTVKKYADELLDSGQLNVTKIGNAYIYQLNEGGEENEAQR